MEKTYEIKEGINGSGRAIYLVHVWQGGRCIWIHTFKSKTEAENWIKWC